MARSFTHRSEAAKPPRRTTTGRGLRRKARPRPVLRGSLDHIGLPTLLTMLEMERRTGVLVLRRRGTTGRIYVRDGQPIRAEASSDLAADARDAVLYLLGWTTGEFELEAADVDGDDEVGAPVTFLLMESARLTDEGAALEEDQGATA